MSSEQLNKNTNASELVLGIAQTSRRLNSDVSDENDSPVRKYKKMNRVEKHSAYKVSDMINSNPTFDPKRIQQDMLINENSQSILDKLRVQQFKA